MNRRIFSFVISVSLLFPPYITGGYPIIGETSNRFDNYQIDSNANTQPDFVIGEDMFWAWIDSHPDGGSITLGSDITVTEHILLSGALFIDTGAYGVTLDGGSFFDLDITGEGVDTPVLTVIDPGLRSGSWDYYLPGYNITARGRDGMGGIALHIRSEQDGLPSYHESPGSILSVGKNAVGVLFDFPVDAHFLTVTAEGENSVAVSAPNGASLYYSKLESLGDGARVASGLDILIDACKVTGDVSGADIVERKIIALAGSWLYWPLAQGQELWESSLYRTFYNVSVFSFLLSGDETHPAEVRKLYTERDRDALDNVDTTVPGETVIPGALCGMYQGLGLEGDFPLDLTLDVLETGAPCISSLVFGVEPDSDRRYVYFQIFDWSEFDIDPENGNATLLRSDDEGESWYNFTDSPDVSHAPQGFMFYFTQITEPILFRIQEPGGEYSNIAVIFGYEGITSGAVGGDRIGGDRIGEGPDTRPSPPIATLPPALESDEPTPAQPTPEQPTPVHTQNPSDSETPSASEEKTPTYKQPGATQALPNEWEDNKTIAVSGKRLRFMMDADDSVTFIKNDLRLSIPTSVLEPLNIGDDQLFAVTVETSEPLCFTVSVALDDIKLYNLPCIVTMDKTDYNLSVSGRFDFSELSAKSNTPQTTFPDNEAIQTTDQPENSKNPSAWPWFLLLGTGCAVFGGTAVFLKRRRKKHD